MCECERESESAHMFWCLTFFYTFLNQITLPLAVCCAQCCVERRHSEAHCLPHPCLLGDCASHTHTHTLPNKCVVERGGIAALATNRQEAHGGRDGTKVQQKLIQLFGDRQRRGDEESEGNCVCLLGKCACVCVPELTGHRWSCQTIRGRGGQRRPPQLCCPSCPQRKATATAPPSSSATLLPSSCNAKRCWNRWDDCLSHITLPLIQLSFRNFFFLLKEVTLKPGVNVSKKKYVCMCSPAWACDIQDVILWALEAH